MTYFAFAAGTIAGLFLAMFLLGLHDLEQHERDIIALEDDE